MIPRDILCMLRRNTLSTTLDEASQEPSEISRLLSDTPYTMWLRVDAALDVTARSSLALMTAVQAMSTQALDCIP